MSETSLERPNLDHHRYVSLDEAFRAHRIPLTNQDFVRRLLAPIEIVAIEGTSSYIKVSRADTPAALHIQSGYTNGFVHPEEVTGVIADAKPWRSARTFNGSSLWGASHPVNSLRDGHDARTPVRTRDYGIARRVTRNFQQRGVARLAWSKGLMHRGQDKGAPPV